MIPAALHGPLPLPDRAWVEKLVRNFLQVDRRDPTHVEIEAAIIEWICATGDCILHAVFEVRKARGMRAYCWGACCEVQS